MRAKRPNRGPRLRAESRCSPDPWTNRSVYPSFLCSASPRACRTPGSLSFPLLAALFLGWTALLAARQRPRLKAQSSESQESPDGLGDSSGLCLAALQPGEKLLWDFPPPCLWLCSSLGGGASAHHSRLGQGTLPARTPSRSPRPARPSTLSLKSNRSRLGLGQGQGPGVRGWGHGTGSFRPGQGRGPGPATTHRKNSGEEGLSLVEPASLKPELASFSHLTL